MKKIALLSCHAIAAALLASALPPALAQDLHNHHPQAASATPGQPQELDASENAPWSEGEITRWDARTLKVTIRHGEIKNLGMPPMTMVFRVQEASLIGTLQPGDKVRFMAEQVNGAYTITRMEAAR